MSTDELPQSVDQLERDLERGECYLWRHRERRYYFEFVQEVGPVVTETDAEGNDPHTTGASYDQLQATLRFGTLERIDENDIPVLEADA